MILVWCGSANPYGLMIFWNRDRFSPINTYLRVFPSNTPAANASNLASFCLLRRPVLYFTPIIDVHRRTWNMSLEPSPSVIMHWEKTNNVFRSALCDCSVASLSSSTSSPWLVWLLIVWVFDVVDNDETVLNIDVIFSTPLSPRNKCTTISILSCFYIVLSNMFRYGSVNSSFNFNWRDAHI